VSKYQHFQVIASAQTAERVPKVPGAWHFALPFPMDPDVTWADYFAGVEPRAFLVGIYPDDHAKAGHAYPLDLAKVNYVSDEEAEDNDDLLAAQEAEIKNFLGFAIEGTDYERDSNMTVALAAGVPLRYVQQDQTKPAYEVDTDVLAALPKLGIVLRKGHVFWNTVQ
jgi:hypothetical protein